MQIEIEPSAGNVWGDSIRLKQILFNLLSNAIKFTSKGNISLLVRREVENWVFEVTDSGIGISENHHERIFNPFEQLQNDLTNKTSGTGLGLTITRHLVELMGGSISLQSKFGEGSRFIVRLPLEDSCHEKTAGSDDHIHNDDFQIPLFPQKVRMLVAEDNALNQKVIQTYLQRIGVQADMASNGEEALKMLEKKDYDILLLDIQMPVMDGYETIRRIRSDPQKRELYVIALTAYAMEEDRNRCITEGCDDYLSKPMEMGKLIQSLKNFIVNKQPHKDYPESI